MKPYEVEIFDRHYNFRSNALIDAASLDYHYDALSVDKSTVAISNELIKTREQAESGTTGDGTVSSSDYIRILSDGQEYVGVIVDVTKDNFYTTLTFEPLHTLLNHEVILVADDIKHTTIEKYIRDIISQEFIGNNDSYQNIENLSISTTGNTTGIMDYNDTSDVYVTINILNDLIYPAIREYAIYTALTINFNSKTLIVRIGEINGPSITVESDLSNVITKNFTLRKASSMVNKLTLYDTYDYSLTEYNYYLHPSDYSFDNVNNADRFFPVVNQVEMFDSNAITEDEFLELANQSIRAINKYIEIDRNLSANEQAELNTALQNFFPYIVGSKTQEEWTEYYQGICENVLTNTVLEQSYENFPNFYPIKYAVYNRVSSYDDLQEEGQGSYFYSYDFYPGYVPQNFTTYTEKRAAEGGWYDTFGRFPTWQTIDWAYKGTSTGNYYYNPSTHAELYINVTFRLDFIRAGTDINTLTMTGYLYAPITKSLVSQAISDYKKTPEFKAAFTAYKAANLTAIIDGYAKKVFKNSKYQNLIELTVKADDTMINPLSMNIGQVVEIIHDGVTYNSILTGKEIKGGLVKLIFGTIRLELTKILNMKGI